MDRYFLNLRDSADELLDPDRIECANVEPLTPVEQGAAILPVPLLAREDVRNVGAALKLVFRAEGSDPFDELLKALDKPVANSQR